MATVLCVSNQKGGVGKTTTSNALTVGLAARKMRVLAVDFDPQGNLSFGLGAQRPSEDPRTIYQLIKKETSFSEAVQHMPGGFDVLAANLLLSALDIEFTGAGREFLLRQTLAPVAARYDVILVDTPPDLGLLTINAFTASDYIIIPVLCDMYSLQGLIQLNSTLRQVRMRSNPGIQVAGVLLNRYSRRESISRVVSETAGSIAQSLGMPVFDTVIHSSVAVTQAQVQQENMLRTGRRSRAVSDYRQLVTELFRREVLKANG